MYRRAMLVGLSTLLPGLAGCSAAAGTSERGVAPDRPACADGFRIGGREERIGRGTVPEVAFRLRNDGDVAVEYELRVTFEQATSTGLPEPSGHDILTGTLAPGASAVVTAATESDERTSTTGYDLDVTLACPDGG